MDLITTDTNAATEGTSPHPLDVALGFRIRQRRRELRYSQDRLARRIGITFQQVQKYERGTNRVSFSRLAEIAHALQCSLTDLIGDIAQQGPSSLTMNRVAMMNQPGAAELLEAFSGIRSPSYRQAILNLAKEIAERTAAQAAEKNVA